MIKIDDLKQDVIRTFGNLYDFKPVIGITKNNQLTEDLNNLREGKDFYIGYFSQESGSYLLKLNTVLVPSYNIMECVIFDSIKKFKVDGSAFLFGLICTKK